MTWAQDTVRMEARGTILGVQTWSTGFWFATGGFPVGVTYGQDQLNGLRDSADLQGYWAQWVTDMGSQLSSAVQVTSVEYLLYQPEQKTAVAVAEWIPAAPLAGAGTLRLPAECACCVGFYTGDEGPKGRGRSYLAALGMAINPATAGYVLADVDAVLTGYHGLLSSIDGHTFQSSPVPGDAGYNLHPSLASYMHGTNHRVLTIKADTRVDGQRRREDKLPAQKRAMNI